MHADLVLVLPDQLLRVVRAVERLAGRVVARAGVVAADDQVVRAVVAPDDRVPERLARPGHAHRQRQEREDDPIRLVVVLRQRLVGADAGVVIDVARLGHPDRPDAAAARRRPRPSPAWSAPRARGAAGCASGRRPRSAARSAPAPRASRPACGAAPGSRSGAASAAPGSARRR